MNPPSERVFVSSLPPGLTDAKFKEIFGAYGTIKDSKVLANNCALITFDTLDEARWLVENLDGNMPEGITSPVSVKFGNPPQGKGPASTMMPGSNRPSPYGGKGVASVAGGPGPVGPSIQVLKKTLVSMDILPGGRSSKERSDAQQVYIRGLPPDTTDSDLHDIFGPFGAIPPRGVKAMLSPDGQCTGIGFVDYIDENCAQKAVQALNGTMLPDGTTLTIHVKNSSRRGKGGMWCKPDAKAAAAPAAAEPPKGAGKASAAFKQAPKLGGTPLPLTSG